MEMVRVKWINMKVYTGSNSGLHGMDKGRRWEEKIWNDFYTLTNRCLKERSREGNLRLREIKVLFCLGHTEFQMFLRYPVRGVQ